MALVDTRRIIEWGMEEWDMAAGWVEECTEAGWDMEVLIWDMASLDRTENCHFRNEWSSQHKRLFRCWKVSFMYLKYVLL
jgi:Peroxin 13, N-terminal region/SH3 domain